MTALEKIREFIGLFPGADILQQFQVDYTDQIPANGGVFPSGLVEVDRKRDIFGNVTVTNQYNFGLHYVFEKAPADDVGATANADWIMDFQQWVQEQSAIGAAPVFGDVPQQERIIAQNGVLLDAVAEGIGLYVVELSVRFIKKYKGENKWLT